MERKVLHPQCGNFTRGGETVTGVMLMSDVPDPDGQWWVGGKQLALITWAAGDTDRQTKLYNRVNRIIRDLPTVDGALRALGQDREIRIHWQQGSADGIVATRKPPRKKTSGGARSRHS
jgi:hypothetical protein